jgi:hypothetical protein
MQRELCASQSGLGLELRVLTMGQLKFGPSGLHSDLSLGHGVFVPSLPQIAALLRTLLVRLAKLDLGLGLSLACGYLFVGM